jgi:hypothetical protein
VAAVAFAVPLLLGLVPWLRLPSVVLAEELRPSLRSATTTKATRSSSQSQ